MKLYGSSVYSSFHKDFINWMLCEPKAKKLIRSLKNSTCSEEVVFATLIMNSPYKDTVIPNSYRYIEWNRENLVLYDTDFLKIIASGCFFCRKVDSQYSGELANLLTDYIAHEQ